MPKCVLCGKEGTHLHVTTSNYSGNVHRGCWQQEFASCKEGSEEMAKKAPVTAGDAPAAQKKAPSKTKKAAAKKAPAKKAAAKKAAKTPPKSLELSEAGPVTDDVTEVPAAKSVTQESHVQGQLEVTAPCPSGSSEIVIEVPQWVLETVPEKVIIRVAIDWGPPPPPAEPVYDADDPGDIEDLEDALEARNADLG